MAEHNFKSIIDIWNEFVDSSSDMPGEWYPENQAAQITRLKEQLAEARKLLNCTHNPPDGKIGF